MCVRILQIRHLSTKLYQVHTIHQTFSSNTLLHAVSKIQVKNVHTPATCRTCISYRKRVQNPIQTRRCSHHQRIQTHRPPRLNHSLQLWKFLECGSCALSPLCVVTAIQTREVHGNSVGTRQQLMASVEARHQGLEALWESRARGVDILLFVLTEPAQRSRHGQK